MRNMKSKKGIIIVVVIAIVAVLAIVGAVTGGSEDPATTPAVSTPATEPAASTATTLDGLFAEVQTAVADTEAKTSARVDAIASYVKKAAAAKNEAIGDEAVLFIIEKYPDFFESDELMEQIMVAGYYLEYMGYNANATKFGQDVEQCVKYVYRGAETVETEATQLNLEQIGEVIEGYK